MSKTQRMVWIDMEMTGLNPEKHVILEIATIVTDENLKILEEGPVIAIKRTDAEMDRIEEWSNKTHSSSGLLERSNSSLTNVQEAEKKTLAFLEKYLRFLGLSKKSIILFDSKLSNGSLEFKSFLIS